MKKYRIFSLHWMKHNFRIQLFAAVFLCAAGSSPLSAQTVKIHVHTIGDSTVQFWPPASYPKTGWGQVIPYFFDSNKVGFYNEAVGGASSKSYYEKFWTNTLGHIGAGDVVFIQFGINDMNSKPVFHTEPMTTFKEYLVKYITQTKAKGAYPVLITPMVENKLADGSRGLYPLAIRQSADALKIPLIDLDAASKALLKTVGLDYSSKFIYMNLAPGEYTNYPVGCVDNTHLQEMGAIEMAKLVVQGLQKLNSTPNISKLILCLNPTYRITFLADSSAGLVTRNESFPTGLTVTAKALPDSGFKFVGWSGDLTSTNTITSFVMGSASKVIRADFSIVSGQ
jgi:lysophospholipase L1-like esterase